MDADDSTNIYVNATELDLDRNQPGIGFYTSQTIDCYVRKYTQGGTLLWHVGSKASSAYFPGEMYFPSGIETVDVGPQSETFVIVNDEPAVLHIWNGDGLYVTSLLKDMSINLQPSNRQIHWEIPKYINTTDAATIGELWQIKALVYPVSGKVYVYAQSHEGGQHMRVYEIKGLDGITKVTGLVNL